jgi:hypothetical protein
MKRAVLRSCFALLIAPCAVACTSRPVSNETPTTTTFAAQAALSTTAIDFGRTPCAGASPNDAELTISNTGTIPLGWKATIESRDFTLPASPSGTVEGTVDPGAKSSVIVHAVGVEPETGEVATGALVFASDDPIQPTILVSLKVTASTEPCFF